MNFHGSGFFPDTDSWNRWYMQQASQHSQAGPAEHQGVEEQLSGLQLSESEEGGSFPDGSPAEPSAGRRSSDVGGSMRMPHQSSLRGDWLGSSRHSVDIPRAHLPSATTASRSDLSGKPFNSMRYTAPSEVQPAATRTKDGSGRRLLSRIKSGLGKAFGINRRDKKWSEGSMSDVAYSEDVVHTELRMDFAKRAGMHPDDERYIDQFVEAVRRYEILPDGSIGRGDGRVPDGTIWTNAGVLRGLARWLRAESRASIASRVLNDPESLAADIEDYRASGGDAHNLLKSALSHLRRFEPGERELKAVGPGARLMGRQTHDPHPDDSRVIDAVCREDLSKLEPDERNKAHETASRQRRFSDWLRRENRESIVSRLTGSDEQRQSLDDDYREFTKAYGEIRVNLGRLRLYFGAEPQRWRDGYHPYPDDARIIDGMVNKALSKLKKNEASRRKVALNVANHQRKFSDWLQRKNKGSIASRINSDEMQRWSLKIDFQQFTEIMGKTNLSFKRFKEAVEADAVVDLSSGESSEQEEAGPAGRSRSDQPVGIGSTWPLEQVDASSQGRSGSSLSATQWLGDEHIQRDYELLSQELRQRNPDLAARTRFVDPLIAFQVGQGTDGIALTAFHRIVNDRNGIDTADFLFMPVIDASATDRSRRGSHWSLLLVDRRDRDRPVAYHYNSSVGYNARPAAMLAARVGADLRDAPMRQQENGFDCGVFVVDGTRALVQGLARGRSPGALPLDNLVVNREQLQIRLSSGQGAVAADRPGPSTQFVGSASSNSTWVRDLPTPFWHEGNQAGQPAADSWNMANFSPRPAYPPVESHLPSFEESLGASIFGASQYMPYPQELGAFVPPSWQHGNQRAPQDLMRGMHWYNVLPSAARPRINISIHGVPYMATLGASGKQSDIHVFLQ